MNVENSSKEFPCIEIFNIKQKLDFFIKKKYGSLQRMLEVFPELGYQVLYSILKKPDYLPNLRSIMGIAKCLNCSVEELFSPYFAISTQCYGSVSNYQQQEGCFQVRVSLLTELLINLDIEPNQVFILQTELATMDNLRYLSNEIVIEIDTNYAFVFFNTNHLHGSGYYIAVIDGEAQVIHVVGTFDLMIKIEDGKNLKEISVYDVQILAKYIDTTAINSARPSTMILQM